MSTSSMRPSYDPRQMLSFIQSYVPDVELATDITDPLATFSGHWSSYTFGSDGVFKPWYRLGGWELYLYPDGRYVQTHWECMMAEYVCGFGRWESAHSTLTMRPFDGYRELAWHEPQYFAFRWRSLMVLLGASHFEYFQRKVPKQQWDESEVERGGMLFQVVTIGRVGELPTDDADTLVDRLR